MRTISFISCLYLLLFSASALAQTQTPRYISMTSKTNGYYEYLPEGYTAPGTAVYPLIVYIHGNSERGNGDSTGLLKIIGGGLPKVMSEPGFPTSFTVKNITCRFIVIAPQFGPRPTVLDVDSVLNYVISHYPVDVTRIYLTGFSMGGGACWDYAGALPAFADKIAALVPVSGSGIPDTIKTRTIAAANLPVWATHNDSDFTVPVATTHTYIEYINQAPAPTPLAKKTIFHSALHNAWAATYNPGFRENNVNVFEWMLQYQRTPPPPAAIKYINVNLFGGTYPYGNISWNNWNLKSALTSDRLRYGDASGSSVSAALSQSNGVSDNGATYGGGMAPAEVLRFTSSGSAERFLTLKGLLPSKIYGIELYYASRATSGNATVFSTGGVAQTINTYKNFTNKAVFTNLKSNASGQLTVHISQTGSYNYLNGFVLTEKEDRVNQVPVAHAGTDKIITLPTNSVTLAGNGTDADGTITGYTWRKVAGPLSYKINSPATATTTLSALAEGTYIFRLIVSDNNNATAADDVQVIVKAATAPAGTRYLKVNLYGGTNPYVSTEWNNWNVVSSLTSGNFRFSDATVSSVHAAISQRNGITDNGATYGEGMAPAGVLRYACYSTASRTLTISGLSAAKTYSLELYASRNNAGNTTVFTIANTSQSIVTDTNKTNKAFFTNLMPSAAGQLVITLKNVSSYNYLNGFVLTESGGNNPYVTVVKLGMPYK